MTGPRNWDKELADIDKVIASGGALPPAGSPPARIAAATTTVASPPSGNRGMTRKRDLLWVWVRVLIGIAAVAAMPFWPYSKACGLLLYLYLGITAVVTLFGLWIMHGAWTHRRAVAHIGGLLVFLGGVTFMAIEILQRTSFAATRLPWTCP